MKSTCKDFVRKHWDDILVFVIFVIVHCCMHTDYWDDMTMKNLVHDENFSITSNLINQWNNWSSRLFTEVVMDLVFMLSDIAWRILDVFCVLLLYSNIKYITSKITKIGMDNIAKLEMLLLFMSVPFSLFATAGWMVTTICYLWIITAFTVIIRILIKASNEKVKAFDWLILIFSLLLFGSYDITAIIELAGVLLVYWIYRNQLNKSLQMMVWCGIFISILNIVLFIICPGNRARQVADASNHGTDAVLNLGFLGHLRMGVNSCFYHFLSIPNMMLFLILLIIMLVIVSDKNNRTYIKVLSAIPLSLDVLGTVYVFINYTIRNRQLTYIYPDGEFIKCSKIEQYVIMFIAIIIILIVTFFVFYLFKDVQRIIALSGLYVFGLMPQVALGFTTTVSASCIRMSLYLYYAFLLLTAMFLGYNVWGEKSKVTVMVNRFIVTFGTMGMLMNIAQLIRHIIVYG